MAPLGPFGIQPGVDKKGFHRIGQIAPAISIRARKYEVNLDSASAAGVDLRGLPARSHGFDCGARFGRQWDVAVLVILEVESEVRLGLKMNEPMDQVDVREFEHRLLAWPQAGIAGEHEPFEPIVEERWALPHTPLSGNHLQLFVLIEGQERIMHLGVALEEFYTPCWVTVFGYVAALLSKPEHRFQAGEHFIAGDRL